MGRRLGVGVGGGEEEEVVLGAHDQSLREAGQLTSRAPPRNGGLPCPKPSCKPAGGKREVKARLEEPLLINFSHLFCNFLLSCPGR